MSKSEIHTHTPAEMFIVPQDHVGCALVSNILTGKLGVIDQHARSNNGKNILRNEIVCYS
jgi:hypothetical protein